ncbi:MAG: hypothetical protein WKG01_10010 [Kofleriaceae bacterium]
MDRVTVSRMRVDCAVPRDQPNPMAVRARVDDACVRLPAVLAELLAPLAKLGDEVIVLQRVEITLDLDTSLPADELARAWASRLAIAVATAISPASRTTMLRFPDEAHYLARFLVDAASGRAMQTWYYRRWRGLAPLAISSQLRTAICEHPARGLAALATLSRAERIQVLSTLGGDARRVVEEVLASGEGGDVTRAAQALTPHVAALLELQALSSPWQAALALAAEVAGELSLAELRAAVALAVAVASTWSRTTRVLAPALGALRDAADAPSLAPLLALDEPTRRALLAPLAPLGAPATIVPVASWPRGWVGSSCCCRDWPSSASRRCSEPPLVTRGSRSSPAPPEARVAPRCWRIPCGGTCAA